MTLRLLAPRSDVTSNVQLIRIAEDGKDRDKAIELYKDTQNIHISMKEHLSDQVSNIIERCLFKTFGMKGKCEQLLKTLNSIHTFEARQEKSTLFSIEEPCSQFESKKGFNKEEYIICSYAGSSNNLTRMQFKVYRVSFSCYPRCQHAYKHLKQISERYDHLTEERLPEVYLPVPTYTTCKVNKDKSEFHLCLQTSDKASSVLEIKNVLKRNEELYYIEEVKSENAKELLNANEYLKETYLMMIINETVNINEIPENDNVNTIIATENIKDKEKEVEFYKNAENVHISSMKNISDQVNDLLEQNIFKAFEMKIKCERLLSVLNGTPKADTRQEKSTLVGVGEPKTHFKNKHSSQQRSKSAELTIQRAHVQEQTSPTKRPMSAQECCLYNLFMEVSKLDLLQGRSTTAEISPKLEEEHTIMKKRRTDISSEKENELQNENSANGSNETFWKHVQEHLERVERLYDEIQGMFTRSRVPKDEQPQPDNHFDGTVTNELKDDLKKLSPSIRSCGYRCRSFIVFVDDKCKPEELKPDVKSVLKAHSISSFTIVSSSVKGLSSCSVGSKVAAEFADGTVKYGTLGGFGRASSDEGDNTICLVSRHVVTDVDGNPASTLKVSKDESVTEASIIVDKTIRDRRKSVLDIAAASFENSEKDLNTNYKTSEQKAAKGRLSCYNAEELKGLPVHICGSVTPLGYGTVTMSKVEAVQDNSMDDFIIIEDRENPGREKIPFCTSGDSGSIVCADDQDEPENVQLISMVSGENLQKAGTYFSLNLGKGITQVKEETKSNIQLL